MTETEKREKMDRLERIYRILDSQEMFGKFREFQKEPEMILLGSLIHSIKS